MKRKIIEPVAPTNMEIILTYVCPDCYTQTPVVAPIHPAKIRCSNPQCKLEFPILPVDPTTLQYLKLIFADGAAMVNPDFV